MSCRKSNEKGCNDLQNQSKNSTVSTGIKFGQHKRQISGIEKSIESSKEKMMSTTQLGERQKEKMQRGYLGVPALNIDSKILVAHIMLHNLNGSAI